MAANFSETDDDQLWSPGLINFSDKKKFRIFACVSLKKVVTRDVWLFGAGALLIRIPGLQTGQN